MRPYRRRTYFIERKVQFKYFLLTIGLLVIQTSIVLTVVFAPYIVTLLTDAPAELKLEAARTLLVLDANIWPGLGGIILLWGAFSIFITHRFAGPVFRVRKAAKAIANGDLTDRIKLRKGDDLSELADDINAMADSVATFVATLKNEQESLSACIGDLKAALAAARSPQDEETIQRLISCLEQNKSKISAVLGKYTVPS